MARPSAVIRIEALCQTHDDYELFASLPGAGPVYAARLTAALGSDRSRWTSADELVRFSGIAPIIERSGKQNWIRWRYFCPKFFRQTFHEYAAQSIQDSFWARAYYSMQRAKGKQHHAAVRALAFKWIRLSGNVGRHARPTTKSSIWRVCGRKDRRCSTSLLIIPLKKTKILDLSPSVELLCRLQANSL